MTPSNLRLSDRHEHETGSAHQRLIDDLTRAYQAPAPPSRLDTTVLQAIRAAALHQHRPQARSSWLPRLLQPSLVRRTRHAALAALAAALLLAGSTVATYLHVSTPTPVSAQTILRRAAALQLAPNQAAHLVDDVTMTYQGSTATGTADVWFQTDATGATSLSAQTLSLGKPGQDSKLGPDGTTASAPRSRFIQIGQQILAYNPERQDDKILLSSQGQTRAYPSWVLRNTVFDGAGVAHSLSSLAGTSPQQIRLLPQQTLSGVTVDVIEVDGWTERPGQRTTLYFDAQTYVLRGFDAASQDPSYPTPAWQVRLSSYDTMAATAVPPGTFALDAPATAGVLPLDLGGPAFNTFKDTMAATCHSAGNVKDMLRSGQGLLAACQATAPNITAAGLVDALSAPDQATLDAATAAGVLTPAQAARYLAQVQEQLTTLVTTPGTPSAQSAAPRK